MGDIDAVEFKAFVNGTYTGDGSHGLFRFETAQGPFTVAIPAAQLPGLMASISNVAGAMARLKTGTADQKHAFPAVWWHASADGAGGAVLSFRVPGGMELSFTLGKSNIPLLREALAALEKQD